MENQEIKQVEIRTVGELIEFLQNIDPQKSIKPCYIDDDFVARDAGMMVSELEDGVEIELWS